jgi:hypothetical protein
MTNEHFIIPPALAISSMRDSGYKDAAHAVAELIDNSVQAGSAVEGTTQVEILCVDATVVVNQRESTRIDTIAVYDNASGMDADTLRIALQFGAGTHRDPSAQDGIGKFGMGLPNSSISQCRHVDVWTWQNGKCFYTYLDIDEVESGEMVFVPVPEPASLPDEWKKIIRDDIGPHGTLVVWSNIDRCAWVRSAAFLSNSEALVGRMYRHFLQKDQVNMRLASFHKKGQQYETTSDRDARPNDPLGLMTNTICEAPWDSEPPFVSWGAEQEEILVGFRGEQHKITIRYSICKQEVRDIGGNSAIGRWAGKTMGISLIRAGREIELTTAFNISYDPIDRWWGVEIEFSPALDNLFGVTNNKQSCTKFRTMDIDADAEAEELSVSEYKELLQSDNDPRLALYMVNDALSGSLTTLRQQIKAMKAPKPSGKTRVVPTESEQKATEAKKKRSEETGTRGESDDQEDKLPADERREGLKRLFVDEGHNEIDAEQLAIDFVHRQLKFHFKRIDFPGGAIFDVSTVAGVIHIGINTRHPACEGLFDLVGDDPSPDEQETPGLTAVRLLLTAWAQMEDETTGDARQRLEDLRSEWGRIARYGFSDDVA